MNCVEAEKRDILVIGYGNPLRRDDGLGPQAIAELASRLEDEPDVTLHACQQLTPELAVHLADVQTVVFIDACIDAPPGRVECREVVPQPSDASLHSFTPSALLSLTEQVYHRRPRAFVCTAGAECFDIGEGLSPTLAGVMPRLLDCVLEVIGRA